MRPLATPRLRTRDAQLLFKRLLLYDLVDTGLQRPLPPDYLHMHHVDHTEVEGLTNLLPVVAAPSLVQYLALNHGTGAPSSGHDSHKDKLSDQVNVDNEGARNECGGADGRPHSAPDNQEVGAIPRNRGGYGADFCGREPFSGGSLRVGRRGQSYWGSERTVCLGSRNKSTSAHDSLLKNASDQKKLLG